MEFMKVFDQTLRDIKREVNLRVLKVPEIEQKVLDATNDEPWGPHGSALAEIARETKKLTECQMIMNVLWTRLSETGANWRHAYKALAVIEYLVANGSESAVDDIVEHIFQISPLSGFEYVEPNGKDMGINVRKKVETILGLLNDREKLQAVRDKAAATRDKYFGLSSSGITYKSSPASVSSSSFSHGSYGGYGGSNEGEKFKDSYKEKDQYEEQSEPNGSNRVHENSRESHTSQSEGKNFAKGFVQRSSTTNTLNKQGSVPYSKNGEDDEDDFDPRRSSTAGSATADLNQVDLFGDNLTGDLMNVPASVPIQAARSKYAASPEVDLFEDAAFVPAPPQADSHIQNTVDLFASQTVMPATCRQMDLFKISNSAAAISPKPPQSEPTLASSVDPFAAVPLNTFEESDIFGTFTSSTDPINTVSSQSAASEKLSNPNQPASTISKHPKKDIFQVKSGIWADSLSRGLIDLNIAAPKKISLADVGVVGDLGYLSEEKEKRPPASAFMGRAMGIGSGHGKFRYTSSMGSGGSWDFPSFGEQK